jgi:molybdenum cofactor cytidylyltransferase
MNPESCAALVLAAGYAKRMGDLKPLMTLGGMTVIERVIRLFQSCGIRRIQVVVGYGAEKLIPLVRGCGACSVVNDRFSEGMFSSVAAGASSLDEDIAAFFVLPADIPLVRPATVTDLLQAFPGGTTAICHPTFAGRRGHPPLIGGSHIRSILQWREEGGLGALLARLESHAVDVPVVDEFIHHDMDRPADYRRMVERLKRRKIFSPAECEALLNDRLQVAPAVAAHGRAVADKALCLGKALNQAGFALNLRLIFAAAFVHDMARGDSDHARRGANLLRKLHMPRMADIVATHMEIAWNAEQPVREAEVVFLADKLVEEDRFVGLAERFERRLREFPVDSPARDCVLRRLGTARQIAEQIETLIGRSPASLRDCSPAVCDM